DEGHRCVPVPAGEVDGRVSRVLGAAELLHQLRHRGVELGKSLGGLRDPRLLVLVGAVDDTACTGVVRDGVELAVVAARLRQPGEPGAGVREVGAGEWGKATGRPVLWRAGVADTAHM